ncbi:MAG: TonB family protein [Acidobacteria bacterium]|nr:TonB family protein [Acidobacteriota bacterium]
MAKHGPRCGAVAVLLIARALAQDPVYQVGPDVTAPKVVHQAEPEYSEEARKAGVSGSVVFEAIVDRYGNIRDVAVLSPLGFGLDERAQAAIEKWRFKPGVKDGQPVSVRCQIEVNFRLLDRWFDQKAERQRTAFNLALNALRRAGPNGAAKALDTILKLEREKFPPAMHLAGDLLRRGDRLPKDEDRARALFRAAAAKDYGPAIHALAEEQINGKGDLEQAIQMMKRASMLGSPSAQYALGRRSEEGEGLPKDAGNARRYYRLCAAAGLAQCQYRLAKLLLERPGRQEHDYLQALAWFELAALQGEKNARAVLDRERPNLSAEQSKWVERLRNQLIRPR